MTARPAGAPPGHSVPPALPSVAGGCRPWTGGGGCRCPLSVAHSRRSAGIAAGSPSRAARGYQVLPGAEGQGSASSGLRQLPGRGRTGRGISAQPGDLSRVTPVSLQAKGAAGAAAGHSQASDAPLLPPGMFARWHGDRGGDREGSDRAALGTGGFFLALTQDPKACPQPRASGMWGRASSCPTLLRVGEAELRQEC